MAREKAQEFIDAMENALKGVRYEDESTPTQIKNGTLIIRVNDLDLVKEEMAARGIEESDFKSPENLREYYKRWSDPTATESGRKSKLAQYTIYARGGIRVLSGSSDAFKFDPNTPGGIESAANWIKNHFRVWAIQNVTSNLNPEKFGKFKKGYDLDLNKLKDFINDSTFEKLTLLKQKSPEMMKELAPDIMILCFFAFDNDAKVGIRYSNEFSTAYTMENKGDFIEYNVSTPWKVGNKNKNISFQLSKSWHTVWGGERLADGSLRKLIENSNIPDYYLAVVNILVKKPNYDFESIKHEIRGARAAHKYGI